MTVLAALAAILCAGAWGPPGARAAAGRTASVTVDVSHPGRAIPSRFLGLGFEYKTLARYAGAGTMTLNPVLVQLIANLSPDQGPVLRIGGDTTDWSWWPVPGMRPPPPVSDAITPQWLGAYRQIQRRLDARLILGINLQTDSKVVADTEARALLRGVGPAAVEALEPGNEPELYPSFGFSESPGGALVAKPVPNWDFDQFERGFGSIASSLPAAPVAGPTMGDEGWDSDFGRFLRDQPRVKLATAHRYPLDRCSQPTSPRFPAARNLLTAAGQSDVRLSALVGVAHHHRLPLRVDEMNITPCPERAGELRGSSVTALWATAILFRMLSQGVDGVNVQSSTGSNDDLFAFEHTPAGWLANVAPEYYGLLLFAEANPIGARLLRLAGAPSPPVFLWATLAPDGMVRVVVINGAATQRRVAVGMPGVTALATLERLLGPAHQGAHVTRGGRTFGAETATGTLPGRDRTGIVKPSGQGFVVSVPGVSAALLTVDSR